ncbi:MAG: oligosaccharide flippase family protein [Bacteroidia bacterium]|nr:oligosaccharide flippase family protein [Bacteroidia bacterium]
MRTQLLKSGLIYTALGFLNPISRLFIFPVFVNLLQQDDYGVISITSTFVAILLVVLPFGFDSAFSRLFFEHKGDDLKRFYHSVVVYVTVFAGALIVLLELVGPWLFGVLLTTDKVSFGVYGRLAYATALGSLFTSIHQLHARNQLKPVRFAAVSLSQFTVSTGFELIAVLYLKEGAFGVLLARCLGICMVSLVLTVPVWWQSVKTASFRFFRPVFLYGAPMFIYNILTFVYFQYDRIQIENYLDLASVAIYSVAFTLAHSSEIFLMAMVGAILPNVYRLLGEANRDMGRISRLLRGMGYAELGFVAVLFLALPVFIQLFTPPEYSLALPIGTILVTGFLFRYMYIVYTVPIFYQRDQVRRTVWLNVVCGVVVVVANVLLLPRIGLWGAPISMILSRAAQLGAALLLYRSVSRRANLPIQLGRLPIWYLVLGVYAVGLVLIQVLTGGTYLWAYGVPLVAAVSVLAYLAARSQWQLSKVVERI